MTNPCSTSISETDPPYLQFWWLHDARWYQGVLKRFGAEAANEINEEAARFVARRVGRWCVRHYDIRLKGRSIEEFLARFALIQQVMFPDDGHMRVQHTVLSDSEWETVITDIFPKRMLRAAGTLDGYQCPCMAMRSGWFEAVGVDGHDQRLECELQGGDACRFRMQISRKGEQACDSSAGTVARNEQA
ncbi:hypothetical protein ACWCQZ_47300 [Streptomyces sp. NPDC002285]